MVNHGCRLLKKENILGNTEQLFLLTKQIVSLLACLFVSYMGRASIYLLPGCQFKRGLGTHSDQ